MAPDKTPTNPRRDQYWLFWDGACGFCRRSVDWITARDAGSRLLPTPYQQVPNPPMDPALAAACQRAVHLMHPDGRIERAGRACLTALELIGYAPVLVRIMRMPPLIWLLEIGYWLTARNRSFFSRFLFR
tara:strand:- start:1127 stop:1516 length:390 start_codon:yes stop_codon:yes gene_type:complete